MQQTNPHDSLVNATYAHRYDMLPTAEQYSQNLKYEVRLDRYSYYTNYVLESDSRLVPALPVMGPLRTPLARVKNSSS